MTDQTARGVDESGDDPGGVRVGRVGITVVTMYLVLLSAALLYCLIILWPNSASPQAVGSTGTTAGFQRVVDTSLGPRTTDLSQKANATTNVIPGDFVQVQQLDPSTVSFIAWSFRVSEETRLFLLVVCAGALGSLVHGLRSVYWYAGNRNLIWSWVPKYWIQPFGASVLAVVFYLVIRGGFFSADAGSQHTSPFGFVALSAMVGMFSEQAVLKLKDIAETLLTKPPPGKDTAKPESSEQNKGV